MLDTVGDKKIHVIKAVREITGLGRLAGTVVAIDAPRASALGVGHQPTDSPEVRRVACGFDERVPEHLKANYRQAAKK